jgi:hypothetical protein
VEPLERLPRANWGLVFGDAVTNLRSSLDHIAWELSRFSDIPVSPREEANIYFPLLDSRPQKSRDFNSRVRFFPGRAQREIERFQPYNCQNWPELLLLSKLNYLANRDKHRVVIPAYTRGRMRFGRSEAWVTVSLKENRPIQVSPDFIRRLGDDFNPQFRADIAFFEASDRILQGNSFGMEFLYNVHNFVRDQVFPPFKDILEECYRM